MAYFKKRRLTDGKARIEKLDRRTPAFPDWTSRVVSSDQEFIVEFLDWMIANYGAPVLYETWRRWQGHQPHGKNWCLRQYPAYRYTEFYFTEPMLAEIMLRW